MLRELSLLREDLKYARTTLALSIERHMEALCVIDPDFALKLAETISKQVNEESLRSIKYKREQYLKKGDI